MFTFRVDPWNLTTYEELEILTKNGGSIYASVAIRGQYIKVLQGLVKVVGSFGLVDSTLESLGSLKDITENCFTTFHQIYPALNNLGNLEKVGGNVMLQDMNIVNLGSLRHIDRNLNLRNTPIQDLGNLEYVGGNLYLPKQTEGKLDLSKVKIIGKLKYFNDQKSRLDKIPKPHSKLVESLSSVPYWRHIYAHSSDELLSSATPEQKAFYQYFKDSFLNGQHLDLKGNTNYVFLLLFELINDFKIRQDLDLLKYQLTTIGDVYPVTERYATRFLDAAITGEIVNEDDESEDYDESEINWDDIEDEDFEEEDEIIESINVNTNENEGEYAVRTEELKFPPENPVYIVKLVNKVENVRNYNKPPLEPETEVIVDDKKIAVLKAEVDSVRADVVADRLFMQTSYSDNVCSFSVFCYQLSSGNQLWQARDITPGGSLYFDHSQRTLEVGRNYGYEDTFVILLDYDGKVLKRNFRNGYEMVEVAEKKLAVKEFEEAKELFLQALETKISDNTKIKVSDKLVKIGEFTGDKTFSEEACEKKQRYEIEKAESIENSCNKRLYTPPTEKEEAATEDYWSKRRKQEKQFGGN